MKYPISVHDFEELRTEGYVYVDKTKLVYDLVSNYKSVFLGRPRAFGKSLLLSTIREFFLGKQALFKGLDIERLVDVWRSHSVIHLKLLSGNFTSVDGLLNLLSDELHYYELHYFDRVFSDLEPQFRLRKLIRFIHKAFKTPVVVLIEDYDKPLLEVMGNEVLEEAYTKILKPFFGVLKSESNLLRFVMLTGSSGYSKFSVLSDLDGIEDISLDPKYAEICGFTREEIISTFSESLKAFVEKHPYLENQIVDKLIFNYGGYRFSKSDIHVCCPSSVLRSLKNQELDDYWYEYATPGFLIKYLIKNDSNHSRIKIEGLSISDLYKSGYDGLAPLLYQTGYLTIKTYEPEWCRCDLDFPNKEVQNSYYMDLLPLWRSCGPILYPRLV